MELTIVTLLDRVRRRRRVSHSQLCHLFKERRRRVGRVGWRIAVPRVHPAFQNRFRRPVASVRVFTGPFNPLDLRFVPAYPPTKTGLCGARFAVSFPSVRLGPTAGITYPWYIDTLTRPFSIDPMRAGWIDQDPEKEPVAARGRVAKWYLVPTKAQIFWGSKQCTASRTAETWRQMPLIRHPISPGLYLTLSASQRLDHIRVRTKRVVLAPEIHHPQALYARNAGPAASVAFKQFRIGQFSSTVLAPSKCS